MRRAAFVDRLNGRHPAIDACTATRLSASDDEVHTAALDRAITEVSRALLKAKWALTDARIADEVRKRGSLPEGDLSEDEIARIAVAMTADTAGAESG